MKRLLCLFSVIFSLLLSSCGANLVAIEDCDWKMRAVMSASVEEGGVENDLTQRRRDRCPRFDEPALP